MHVLALALQRGIAVLPSVAAIEERDAITAFAADRLEDGRDPIKPADPSVGLGQRGEIVGAQRIGRG
jgi:hypothetical protein